MKIFKQYPNLQVYYETSDGTAFFKEEDAKTYAKSLKGDKDVKTVKRSETEKEGEDGLKTDYQEVLALVPEMDKATAESYLENENKRDKPRKSVVEALSAKITELENAG